VTTEASKKRKLLNSKTPVCLFCSRSANKGFVCRDSAGTIQEVEGADFYNFSAGDFAFI